jgi:YHS domain-containing protein
MRLLIILLWLLVVLALLLPLLRRVARAMRRDPVAGRGPALLDELVKDPVCQVYVVRSRARSAMAGGARVFFCSDDCARRYAGSSVGGSAAE